MKGTAVEVARLWGNASGFANTAPRVSCESVSRVVVLRGAQGTRKDNSLTEDVRARGISESALNAWLNLPNA
jgi:hypothetical protein